MKPNSLSPALRTDGTVLPGARLRHAVHQQDDGRLLLHDPGLVRLLPLQRVHGHAAVGNVRRRIQHIRLL